MLKCADVSHPCRTLHVHQDWSERISREFYAQGDREVDLGLPVSPLCDRKAHNLARSQLGFVNFVVLPAFSALTSFCQVETWMNGLRANLAHWTALADEVEGEKAACRSRGALMSTPAVPPHVSSSETPASAVLLRHESMGSVVGTVVTVATKGTLAGGLNLLSSWFSGGSRSGSRSPVSAVSRVSSKRSAKAAVSPLSPLPSRLPSRLPDFVAATTAASPSQQVAVSARKLDVGGVGVLGGKTLHRRRASMSEPNVILAGGLGLGVSPGGGDVAAGGVEAGGGAHARGSLTSAMSDAGSIVSSGAALGGARGRDGSPVGEGRGHAPVFLSARSQLDVRHAQRAMATESLWADEGDTAADRGMDGVSTPMGSWAQTSSHARKDAPVGEIEGVTAVDDDSQASDEEAPLTAGERVRPRGGMRKSRDSPVAGADSPGVNPAPISKRVSWREDTTPLVQGRRASGGQPSRV
jgi:hypothetical protein